MKKVLKWCGFGLGGIVALLVLVGVFLPSTYAVQRSLVVDAPAGAVFAHVNDLKKNEAWSPWSAADRTLKTHYGSKTVGKGATARWSGEESGQGTMEITYSEPEKRIDIDLDFGQQGKAKSFWKFDARTPTQTKVTWGMSGDAGWNLVGRYFGLRMDSMVGPYYEDGLQRLAKVAAQ